MRPQAGFSLLEVIVALAIMAVSLGALYHAAGGAMRGVQEAEQRTRASALALALLDMHSHVPSSGLVESGRSGDMDWSLSTSLYLAVDPPGWSLHRVEVTVSWGESNRRRLVWSTLLPQRRGG
ncbi:MAG: prepilin-type N-terminal cleavage/methylation domain-containing protein [Azoarcus sp.]|jgi:general secretion pathway protein I|nr:prepilin-type N-terminal cleavage/methylation domain-containing protein [Azoarcus sp.]